MTQNFKAPKLRFPGFTDDWEQRKLSTLAEFNPKSALPEYFEYVDLESVVGTEMVSHRTEEKVSAPSRAQRLAKEGDVFYQTVRPYQRNNYLFNKADDNHVFSTGYAQMRPYGDGYFLLSLVQTDNFVNVVLDNCTGTSYPAINSTELSNIEVSYPKEIEEQKKIGTYFKNLDNLITLHQRKFETLKKLKKGFLQKMFPKNGESVPEIRFPGFTDAWEQRKLGELAPLRGGFAFKSEKFTTAGIPIVKISNILQDGSVGSDFSCYEMIPDDENFTLRNGDTVLAMSGATTGKVSVLTCTEDEKYYQNQRVGFFTRKGNFNYDFVSVIVRSHLFIEQLKSVLVAGAQPNVSPKDIDSFEFMVPQKFVEQEKIGHFFKSLDKLITLHQRKLDTLKKLKQGMLQQMFI